MRWMMSVLLGIAAVQTAFASDGPKNMTVAETRINGDLELVRTALVEEMTERQYSVVDQTGSELRFARPVDNADLREKLGSLSDPLPQARVIMSLTGDGAYTAVRSDFFIVTDPGTEQERLADVRGLGIDPRLQDMLDGIDGTVEAIAARNAKSEKTTLAQAPGLH